MNRQTQFWVVALVLALGCYIYSKDRYANTMKSHRQMVAAWEAKDAHAKSVADKTDAEFPESRLDQAKARAKEANTWVHPYNDWMALRQSIEQKYPGKGGRPLVAIKSYVARVQGAEAGGPAKCYVTISFDDMDNTEASFEAIKNILALMDKSVQGCQRVELNLAPPLADGTVPAGAFVNSKAVYQFNVIGAPAQP